MTSFRKSALNESKLPFQRLLLFVFKMGRFQYCGLNPGTEYFTLFSGKPAGLLKRWCLRACQARGSPGVRQHAFNFDESNDFIKPHAVLDGAHDKWTVPAHAQRVFSHYF